MSSRTLSPSLLIAAYAEDIAFVAEEKPATTLNGLGAQLDTAVNRMEMAGLHVDDLECAVTYLSDAHFSEGEEQQVLLKKADQYLKDVNDLVDEYRDMV